MSIFKQCAHKWQMTTFFEIAVCPWPHLSSLLQYTIPTPVASLHLISRIQDHLGIPVTLPTGSILNLKFACQEQPANLFRFEYKLGCLFILWLRYNKRILVYVTEIITNCHRTVSIQRLQPCVAAHKTQINEFMKGKQPRTRYKSVALFIHRATLKCLGYERVLR